MISIIKKGTNKAKIQAILKERARRKPPKSIDVKRYSGVIKLKEDPLEMQKKWRNEWQ